MKIGVQIWKYEQCIYVGKIHKHLVFFFFCLQSTKLMTNSKETNMAGQFIAQIIVRQIPGNGNKAVSIHLKLMRRTLTITWLKTNLTCKHVFRRNKQSNSREQKSLWARKQNEPRKKWRSEVKLTILFSSAAVLKLVSHCDAWQMQISVSTYHHS